jgi:radical SAM superfamily enzyme YgiQ (UPF0313 family)
MQLDVLIINSPLFREKKSESFENTLPPIGLGYLATSLSLKGFSVNLIDSVSNNIPIVKLLDIAKKKKPNFVAINIFSTNYDLVKEFVENFRGETHFVIGGIATKALYKKIIKWHSTNLIDIVYGDGELIIQDIVSGVTIEEPKLKTELFRYFVVDKNSIYFIHNISNIKLDRKFL